MTEPGLGHNSQAISLEEALNPVSLLIQLQEDHVSYTTRRDALLAGVMRFHAEFTDGIQAEADQRRASDFVRQIKLAAKDAEEARKAAGTPLLEATRVINAFFKTGIVDKLADAARSVEAAMTVFAVSQERAARLAAQAVRDAAEAEANRLSAEAERTMRPQMLDRAIQAEAVAEGARKAADASVSDLSRTRGDLGGVTSLRSRWTYKVTNPAAIPVEYMVDNQVMLNEAIRKGLRELPGIEIYNDMKAVVR